MVLNLRSCFFLFVCVLISPHFFFSSKLIIDQNSGSGLPLAQVNAPLTEQHILIPEWLNRSLLMAPWSDMMRLIGMWFPRHLVRLRQRSLAVGLHKNDAVNMSYANENQAFSLQAQSLEKCCSNSWTGFCWGLPWKNSERLCTHATKPVREAWVVVDGWVNDECDHHRSLLTDLRSLTYHKQV